MKRLPVSCQQQQQVCLNSALKCWVRIPTQGSLHSRLAMVVLCHMPSQVNCLVNLPFRQAQHCQSTVCLFQILQLIHLMLSQIYLYVRKRSLLCSYVSRESNRTQIISRQLPGCAEKLCCGLCLLQGWIKNLSMERCYSGSNEADYGMRTPMQVLTIVIGYSVRSTERKCDWHPYLSLGFLSTHIEFC